MNARLYGLSSERQEDKHCWNKTAPCVLQKQLGLARWQEGAVAEVKGPYPLMSDHLVLVRVTLCLLQFCNRHRFIR